MALSIKTDNLPNNSEEAFAEYERRAREAYEERVQNDRQYNSDQNGNYEGSYEPERSYVTAILAFLDEYSIDTDIEDISDLGNEEFFKHFGRFKSKVEYVSARFELRKNRISNGAIGTTIRLTGDYKSEVGSLLERIRKVVNQEVEAGPKKEKIFSKIASLQSEVDRDLTTVDAAFGRVLDLSKLLGQSGANIKPAVDQLERIKKIFWDNSEKIETLPKPDRPKMLPKQDESDQGSGYGSSDMDDEIPF